MVSSPAVADTFVGGEGGVSITTVKVEPAGRLLETLAATSDVAAKMVAVGGSCGIMEARAAEIAGITTFIPLAS